MSHTNIPYSVLNWYLDHTCLENIYQSLFEQGTSFPDATSPVQVNFPIIQPKIASNYADFPFYTMGSFPPGLVKSGILHLFHFFTCGAILTDLSPFSNIVECCAIFLKSWTFIIYLKWMKVPTPRRFVSNIGGLVSSRSVRLLDKLESMSEESDTRDKLWLELRKEVRTHMKTLGCTAVIGYRCLVTDPTFCEKNGKILILRIRELKYRLLCLVIHQWPYFSEQSTICDKLCVLSAIGTAVILNPSPSLDEFSPCKPCHIPYNVQSSPFNITTHSCSVSSYSLFCVTLS